MIKIKQKNDQSDGSLDKPTINTNCKGNPVFKYLVPADKYFKVSESQIADFLLPKQRILIQFINLAYLESFPNFINDMLIKLNKTENVREKDISNRFLVLLLDKEDTMDYISEIQLKLITYRIKLFLLWSYEELAEFLKRLIES